MQRGADASSLVAQHPGSNRCRVCPRQALDHINADKGQKSKKPEKESKKGKKKDGVGDMYYLAFSVFFFPTLALSPPKASSQSATTL